MANRAVLIIWAILAAIFLTSCQDKVEVEERAYAGAIAIDKAEDGEFFVSVELLALKEQGGKDQEDGGRRLLSQAGETVSQALGLMNEHNAKRLNLGLAKACLFGESILKDPVMFREAVDALERDGEINNMLLVLAVDGEGKETLSTGVSDEISLGFFISNYYANNEGAGGIRSLELEKLAESLDGDGFVLIPALNASGGPVLSGGAAIADGSLTGWLADSDIKGLAWVTGHAKNSRTATETAGFKASFTVAKTNAKLDFDIKDGVLCCLVVIEIEAALDSISPSGTIDDGKLAEMENGLAEQITADTVNTFTAARELGVDCYDLAKRLKKQKPELYAVSGGALDQMVFTAQTSVKITNTGSIK